MNSSEKKDWTASDGWTHLKKLITRPEKAMTIQEGLIKLNSRLTLIEDFVVTDKNRQSQIFTGSADGSTTIDFWENGMYWHSQALSDLSQVTIAIYLWNDLRTDSHEIEKEIPEIKFPLSRKKIEIANEEYIKWHWQNLTKTTEHRSANEIELIEFLRQNNTLNRLMTFHQLWDFGLSRNIGNYGDSLKNDLLRATIKDEIIEVRTEEQAIKHLWKGTNDCLGKGNPQEAYKLIVDNLPSNLSWAEYQTLEQFLERTQKSNN